MGASLIDILSSMGDFVTQYLQGLAYVFQVIFNLNIGGIAFGYIVIVGIAIAFVFNLFKYVMGGDD